MDDNFVFWIDEWASHVYFQHVAVIINDQSYNSRLHNAYSSNYSNITVKISYGVIYLGKIFGQL